MDMKTISLGLNLSDTGLWVAETDAEISYPEEGYDQCFAIEEKSFWFKHRNKVINTAIKMIPPKETGLVLDVGGGNGFVAKSIQDLGLDVILLEPGMSGALNAKERGLKTVVCTTLEEAKFHDKSVAAVGLFDVLEHVEDDSGFLTQINRIIDDNGKLYITVPAYPWLWSKDDAEAGHFRRYTGKGLCKVLNKSGFKISYSSYFFWFLPFPIFLFRTIPSFLNLTKNIDEDKHASDHRPKLGIFQKLLDALLMRELIAIRKLKECLFGGSIILVATKETPGAHADQ